MLNRQMVNCPNCGSLAERIYSRIGHIQTECLVCDYLMVMYAKTGKVIECCAPGIYPERLQTPLSLCSMAISENARHNS